MTDSMQAVVRDGHNNPPVSLRAVDEPRLAPDETLVEVRASTINRGELRWLRSRPTRPDLAGVPTQAVAMR